MCLGEGASPFKLPHLSFAKVGHPDRNTYVVSQLLSGDGRCSPRARRRGPLLRMAVGCSVRRLSWEARRCCARGWTRRERGDMCNWAAAELPCFQLSRGRVDRQDDPEWRREQGCGRG